MLSKFFYLSFFLSGMYSHAQAVRHPVSFSYVTLGTYSSNLADAFTFSSNPASLAQIKNSTVGCYSERRFLMSDLNNFSLAAGLKMNPGSGGLRIAYSGFAYFNETHAGLTYARKLSENLDAGVQFNYYTIKVPGYGKSSTVSFAIGYLFHLNEKIHFGMQTYNPFGGKFGNNEQEKLASTYSFGIGYEASSKFFLSTVIEKEEDLPVNVNVGFQYNLLSQLMLRFGINSETSNVYSGIGFKLKALRIDVITTYHPMLGISPAMLFLFNFKKSVH